MALYPEKNSECGLQKWISEQLQPLSYCDLEGALSKSRRTVVTAFGDGWGS